MTNVNTKICNIKKNFTGGGGAGGWADNDLPVDQNSPRSGRHL